MEHVENLGEAFKSRRHEMNLSLKEVENATSIRMNYLKAIEDGELGHIISEVYAKGFMKQYASFLGLDGDALINGNPLAFNKPSNQEFSYGIGTLEVRGHPGNGVKWLPNAAWLGVSVAVLLAAWYFARFLGVI